MNLPALLKRMFYERYLIPINVKITKEFIPAYNILTNLKTFKLGKIKVLSLFLFYLYFWYIII